MSLDLTLKNREFNLKVANSSGHTVYEFEDFRLDAATRLLYHGGEQIDLTPKAVETLIALVEGEGNVISKDDLMQRIWADTVVEESNLAQYLHVLRKTLGDTSDGKPYIETLKRRGYRFNGTVRLAKNEIGSAKHAEAAKEVTEPPAAQPKNTSSSPRGNVRVIGNVAVDLDPGQEIERADNIYTVPGWVREPAIDTPPPVTPTRPKWLLPVAIVILAVASVGAAVGIYKFSTRGQTVESRSIPFLGSDMTRITTTGKSKYVAVSPDGRYVAHIVGGEDGESLWVRQVAVANDLQIAPAAQRSLVWVTFSPDGNFVYYLALERDKGSTELFRVPVLGGPTLKVAHDIGAPSFSPDGTKVAYMMQRSEETRVIVASTDSLSETMQIPRQAPDFMMPSEVKLASRKEPDYLNAFWFSPAWSPDSRSLAFPVAQGDEKGRYETVLAVDVDTGAERKLTDTRWQQVGQPQWLADGLVLTASESSTAPQQLWHISLPDGTATRVTRDVNNYQNLSLTSDGKTLAIIQNHAVSNIWTVGSDGSAAKQVISEAGLFNEIIWLPDGRIAYTSNAGGTSDIWTVDADGKNLRQLTVGANARLGLAATTDQKHLIFSAERNGKYNLWRIGIDGSGLTRITSGDGEYYPQCTPDGMWIVYQSGGNFPTLWKLPISGGEAMQLTKTTASRPSLSPDGRFIAYHYLDSSFKPSRWGIGISGTEDGTRVKRFDFSATVVERLVKWTPDGKNIAFLNSPNGVPNIWLQPIDGGEPKQLTDFPSDNIIAFNWNADGKQLAVIRGVETSDVLLINRSSSK
ncbi:MAG: winged helix-turn-helix domain-containing protein [Pyrinomonadaceae bacterium]